MNARIDQAVSSGKISAADQTAFAAALDSIDATLSGATTGSSSASVARSGGSMQSRMDTLIDAQVDAGKLTDDQAAELKSLFAPPGMGGAGMAQGSDETNGIEGVEGMGGGCMAMGGPRGMGPPPPPPGDGSDSSTSSTDETSDSATEQLDALIAFLENLRESMKSTDVYGSSSSDGMSTATTGMVVDIAA